MKKIKGSLAFNNCLPYLAIFLSILALLYVQIMGHITIIGSDTYFHLARFYDIKKQILTGSFSWFQTNFTFEQTGRIINALYGPLFAYCNAFLLLLVRSWFQYEVITNILVDFIAAAGMYKLAVKVKTPKIIAVILSLIYINIGMIPAWTEGMNFSACAGVVIPYLLMQVVNMLEDKERPIHVISLATCISLIGNIHLLSTIMISLILIPIVIVSFFRTQDKKWYLVSLIKAIILTFILTASVWGGLLVVYSKNMIATPLAYDLHGAVIGLSKFQTVRQFILPSTVILFVGQGIYAFLNWKKQKNNLIITSLGLIYLLLSTNYLLNWGWVQNNWPIIASIFQFPFRFVTIAYPVLLLGIAYSFSTVNFEGTRIKKWNIASVLLLFAALQASFATYKFISDIYSGQYLTNSVSALTKTSKKPGYVRDITESQAGIFNELKNIQPDYLPTNKGKKKAGNVVLKYDSLLLLAEREKINKKINKDGSMTLTWKSTQKSKIVLPIVMYRQSRLEVNGNKHPMITQNEIGVPTVWQNKGRNSATLKFIIPKWFLLLLWASVIAWTVLIGFYIKNFASRCMLALKR
ncbi:cell division protein [Lactobacillus psittaci]|uniref:Cell division protein n=1 Tax=Lactobacillus psittaci DSM 15354 TaxID=1122152 RepID=A0A0R1S3Y3_9LACO|nr:cell division protein [Lactobacillus psittaci]KRL63767.1 hypothetical protein FC23_GL000014 [Lactobacillus psittaci DSM 15354]